MTRISEPRLGRGTQNRSVAGRARRTRRALVVAAVTLPTLFAPARVLAEEPSEGTRTRPSSNTFTRMFPKLPPFAQPSDALTAALMDLGRPGGPMDALDDLAAGPKELITNPSLNVNNPNNPTHTAGTTFLGQFVDHDITFDTTSPLGIPTDPGRIRNERTPRLDLDSMYGGGPAQSPALYEAGDPAKLRVESGGLYEDLPRTSDMKAVVADRRNDENLIVAGLHAAFLKFHNRAVDVVRGGRPPASGDFDAARRLTTRHYQWIVLHEFLPPVVGQQVVDDVLRNGRRVYRPKDGTAMPVEFQGAAYRFGHSMVRPSYRANLAGDGGLPFFALVFDPSLPPSSDRGDLVGGSRAPRRFIGWQTFFDFGDGEVKPNKKIDTKLSTPLFNLPSSPTPVSLAQRNLLRHVTWSLPSGQAIAREMGVTPLGPAAFPELAGYGLGLEGSTPLWYYVLKEAELTTDGLRLGPVGGRIVAEVLIGLLQLDQESYLYGARRWTPTLPDRSGRVTGQFKMTDFLSFAGVDPVTRGQ